MRTHTEGLTIGNRTLSVYSQHLTRTWIHFGKVEDQSARLPNSGRRLWRSFVYAFTAAGGDFGKVLTFDNICHRTGCCLRPRAFTQIVECCAVCGWWLRLPAHLLW